LENISLNHIIKAVKDQTNSTNACKLLFGEDSEDWPKGEFRAETFEYLEKDIKNLFDECGAVCLEDNADNLVLFGSDFDLDTFRQKLLHIQQQEQMALLNQQVNEGNSSKTTAFMIAVQWGNLPTVQILLQNGANPVAIDINGINSLMFASSKGHFDIVSLLLTYPININAKDEVGQTALTYANRAGS